MAGEGGVGSAAEADGAGEEPFGGVPKADGVEERVHEVGDGAVVDVFWVGVVDGVVVRRLEQADVLKEGDDGAVFPAGAVGPFVDFVCVGADDGEEPRRQPRMPSFHAMRRRMAEKATRSHELCHQVLRVMWRGRWWWMTLARPIVEPMSGVSSRM